MAAAEVTPSFGVTSDHAPPTVLDSGCEHQQLLKMEAEATLVQETGNSKTNMLQHFLIDILFAALVVAVGLAMANTSCSMKKRGVLISTGHTPCMMYPRMCRISRQWLWSKRLSATRTCRPGVY
ncbi:hypothetical protein MRX96_019816 [Rhipicephalus microplus]